MKVQLWEQHGVKQYKEVFLVPDNPTKKRMYVYIDPWSKELLGGPAVQQQIPLYLIPDGSRVNSLSLSIPSRGVYSYLIRVLTWSCSALFSCLDVMVRGKPLQ